MKKCPQCGTILEESKKRCYMCGTELTKNSLGFFGDTFDEQIGATISNGQDNAFNEFTNLMDGAEGTVSHNDNEVVFSNSVNTISDIQENIDPALFAKYDDRTAVEKIFSTDIRYKDDIQEFKNTNNDFLNGINTDFSNTLNNEGYSNGPKNLNDDTFSSVTNSFSNSKDTPVPTTYQKEVKDNQVSDSKINWGDNLNNSFNISNDNNKKKKNLNLIFNILSIVAFFIMVIFAYFKFVAPKNKDEVEDLGSLIYEIKSDFVLESSESSFRYYSYGNNCALKISYGPSSNEESFLDNYFEQVKNANDGLHITNAKININGNTWTEIKVHDFFQNSTTDSGYTDIIKYKYVAIVYKGNFYDIVFANSENDTKCSDMYDKFQKTLTFR